MIYLEETKMIKYTENHEWVKVDGSKVTMGVSEYAQDSMGDVVFVELPEVDDSFSKGDGMSTIESVKAVSDVYAAVSGTIVEVNEALLDEPELINSDPMGKGWLVVIDMEDAADLEDLMSEEEYEAFIKE
ncbi:glycine cleavage system protein GcvH [Clostridia bacterium]|nr:glycine cleavage system protein GcvH [Clostridia bacterium]